MSLPTEVEVLAEAKRLYDSLPSKIEIYSDNTEALETWRVLVRDYVPELWQIGTMLRDLVLEQKRIISAWETVAPDKKQAVRNLLRSRK